MNDLYQCVLDAVYYLKGRVADRPRVAIVLGTGLGGVAENVEVSTRIPYDEIPHFLESTVEGHRGDLVFGSLAGAQVVVMQGRFHYYEGYSLQQVTLPIRIIRELGSEYLMISSAAGGLNPDFRAGEAMLVTDHLNLLGDNPLRGVTDTRLGDRFPDITHAYDAGLMKIARKAAVDLKIPLRSGVYAVVSGPSLETRAETRMLRMLGADAVGMSTVPEVIVAAQVGLRTLVLAAVTNIHHSDVMEPVSLESVIANAEVAGPKIAAIMEETVRRLSTY